MSWEYFLRLDNKSFQMKILKNLLNLSPIVFMHLLKKSEILNIMLEKGSTKYTFSLTIFKN